MSDINTSVDRFVRLVSADCPGGAEFVKKTAVCQAAVQFFRETRAWREYIPEGGIVAAASPEVDLNRVAEWVSKDAKAMDINGVWLSRDGTPLKKIHRTFLNDQRPGWHKETSDAPTGFFMTPQRMLRVYPAPTAKAGTVSLDLELVMLPDLEAEKFPDFLWDMYAETIAAGAAQRLKSQPGMPWTNPEQAKYFWGKFNDGIRTARLEKAQRVAEAVNDRRRRIYR